MKKVVIGLLVLIIGGAGFISWKHHKDTGTWPWESKQALKETLGTTKDLGQQAKIAGSDAWRWTTDNSAKLYEKSKVLLADLGHKEANEGAVTTADAASADKAAAPADPLAEKSRSYGYGKDGLAKGVKAWKVGLVQPYAAREAKKNLELAIKNFEAAKLEPGMTAADAKKIDAYLLEAHTYLNDTDQMIAKIEAHEKQSSAAE